MRTTITLNDRLARVLKDRAHRSGRPLEQLVDEIMRAGLAASKTLPNARPYKLKPASLGGVRRGAQLMKALRLAAALDDEEIARKLHIDD